MPATVDPTPLLLTLSEARLERAIVELQAAIEAYRLARLQRLASTPEHP